MEASYRTGGRYKKVLFFNVDSKNIIKKIVAGFFEFPSNAPKSDWATFSDACFGFFRFMVMVLIEAEGCSCSLLTHFID